MKLIKIGSISFLFCLLLLGCSNEYIQQKPIYQKATEIKTLTNKAEWDKVKEDSNEIYQLYKDNEWKYQFLGNETEFKTLEQHIQRLIISAEEEDKTEAKFNLSMIEHYVESLYFK